jgi:type I restriction enzyme S subunit
MEVRKGYKKTEVGIIPADWDVMSLARICHMKSGLGITSADINQFSKYPCYGGNGLRGFTNRYTHDGQYALIGRQGALCGNVVGVEGKFFASEHAVVVTPFEQTDVRWLTYILGNMRLNQYSESSAQPGLSVWKLLTLDLAFPSKAEQRAIAVALSDVDALLTALDSLIAKKRLVKQGAMQELLTGKRRLPEFGKQKETKQTEIGFIPKDWKVVSVKNITADHKQGFYTKENYVDNGTYLVRITDLLNPTINFTDMPRLNVSKKDFDFYKIRKNDFLFARSGSIGRYGIVYEDVDAIFGSFIIRFTFDLTKVINEYFGYLYETEIVWKQLLSITQGSSNININANNIKSLKIPLPSLPEQQAIAEILSDMDAEITALESRREKTSLLKQGMMQELLTGKIRLV